MNYVENQMARVENALLELENAVQDSLDINRDMKDAIWGIRAEVKNLLIEIEKACPLKPEERVH